MTEAHSLKTPLTDADCAALRAGDMVLLSGVVFTVRDAAHGRLRVALRRGEEMPFALNGAVIFYAGPTPAPPGRVIGAIGPTTSYRMDPFTPLLLERGLRGMIGKGRRSGDVVRAIARHRAVYFGAIGGIGFTNDGIIELPADAPMGVRYIDWKGLADPVIEIKVTPNRPDALGIHGIARDLAAAGLGKLKSDVVTISHDAPGHNYLHGVSGHEHRLDGPGEYEIGGVFVRCDVSQEADGQASVAAALGLGGLMGLVNCAGIAPAVKTVGKDGAHLKLTLGEMGFRRDARRFTAAASVSVLASCLPEPSGIAILEALALGTPAIATNAGGMPDYIDDGVTGLLVPPQDPSAMADAMLSFLNDAQKAERFGQAARQRMRESFLVERSVNRTEEVLAAAIARHGR